MTTAASAGAGHGYALLWALGFSTLACLVLQEAAGRLRLLSGLSLGAALRRQFPSGGARWLVLGVVLGAILVGNAAYEAGNILGAVSGASLVLGLPGWALTLACGLVAALLLWFNAPGRVAQTLGLLVAVMGVAFLVMAVALRPSPRAILEGLLVPTLPAGAGLLALGLVGTTVVPYNLFLGSGLGPRRRSLDLPLRPRGRGSAGGRHLDGDPGRRNPAGAALLLRGALADADRGTRRLGRRALRAGSVRRRTLLGRSPRRWPRP